MYFDNNVRIYDSHNDIFSTSLLSDKEMTFTTENLSTGLI